MGFIAAGHQRATKVENTKWWWWWSFTSSLLILSSQIECTYVLSSSVCVNVFSFQAACNHCSPTCSHDHICDTTSKSCRNIKPKFLNKPWVFVRILRQGFKVCSRFWSWCSGKILKLYRRCNQGSRLKKQWLHATWKLNTFARSWINNDDIKIQQMNSKSRSWF